MGLWSLAGAAVGAQDALAQLMAQQEAQRLQALQESSVRQKMVESREERAERKRQADLDEQYRRDALKQSGDIQRGNQDVRVSLEQFKARNASEREADRLDMRQRELDLREQLGNANLDARRDAIGIAAARRESLTPGQELSQIRSLNSQYNTNTRADRTLRQQYSLMDGAWNKYKEDRSRGLNPTAQSVLVTFQKVLDPTSVVRESEYARSPNGQAYVQRLLGLQDRIIKGGPGVTDKSLEEFVSVARGFAQNAQKFIKAERDRITRVADKYGLERDLVLSEDPLEDLGVEAPADVGVTPSVRELVGPNGKGKVRITVRE